jgi:hypothetical protein
VEVEQFKMAWRNGVRRIRGREQGVREGCRMYCRDPHQIPTFCRFIFDLFLARISRHTRGQEGGGLGIVPPSPPTRHLSPHPTHSAPAPAVPHLQPPHPTPLCRHNSIDPDGAKALSKLLKSGALLALRELNLACAPRPRASGRGMAMWGTCACWDVVERDGIQSSYSRAGRVEEGRGEKKTSVCRSTSFQSGGRGFKFPS